MRAFPSSRGAVSETLELEVGRGVLLFVHVPAMGGLACCTPYLEECKTLKTSDDAPIRQVEVETWSLRH